MRYPHNLEGYNHCLWKMIREGYLDKAQGFAKVIQFKLKNNIIFIYQAKDLGLFEDYSLILRALSE
jgi:hypothetical protein